MPFDIQSNIVNITWVKTTTTFEKSLRLRVDKKLLIFQSVVDKVWNRMNNWKIKVFILCEEINPPKSSSPSTHLNLHKGDFLSSFVSF